MKWIGRRVADLRPFDIFRCVRSVLSQSLVVGLNIHI